MNSSAPAPAGATSTPQREPLRRQNSPTPFTRMPIHNDVWLFSDSEFGDTDKNSHGGLPGTQRFVRRHPSIISRRWLRGVREFAEERNTTAMGDCTLVGLRYQQCAANPPTAEPPVQPRLLVPECPRGRQILPIRLGHTAIFPRRYLPKQRMPLTFSLRHPFGRHTLSEVPEPSARVGACSFVRDRRSTPPQARPRAEPLSVYPSCLPPLSEHLLRVGLNSGRYLGSPLTVQHLPDRPYIPLLHSGDVRPKAPCRERRAIAKEGTTVARQFL